jgi:hypothetical protein
VKVNFHRPSSLCALEHISNNVLSEGLIFRRKLKKKLKKNRIEVWDKSMLFYSHPSAHISPKKKGV